MRARPSEHSTQFLSNPVRTTKQTHWSISHKHPQAKHTPARKEQKLRRQEALPEDVTPPQHHGTAQDTLPPPWRPAEEEPETKHYCSVETEQYPNARLDYLVEGAGNWTQGLLVFIICSTTELHHQPGLCFVPVVQFKLYPIQTKNQGLEREARRV